MKMGRILVIAAMMVFSYTAFSQGALEWHSEISVQRMPDGALFRFLKPDEGRDTLVEFSTYYFPGIEAGDTVAWDYFPDEDQLYIAAWDPAKVARKHDVKFAVAWRVTSGNPRFGTIKVPAGATLAGFGRTMAYFNVPGQDAYLQLFFYQTYIPGLATVEYSLKTMKTADATSPKYDYYTFFPNFNLRGKKVLNPMGPTEVNKRYEREQFEKDSTLSVPLLAIKNKYAAQAVDAKWGKPVFHLQAFIDSFFWEDISRGGRDYTMACIFVEDKYYHSTTLKGTMVSKYPELVPDRDVSFESFYHQDGVTGWKVVCRALPSLNLRLFMKLPPNTPVLSIDYQTSAEKDITGYFAPESVYSDNKNVMQIAKAVDPLEKAYALYGTYALDHGIECSMNEMRAALIDVYVSMGLSLDSRASTSRTQSSPTWETVVPKYANYLVLLISPNAPMPLAMRKGEGYKWNNAKLNAWKEELKGQRLQIYTDRFSFPEKLSSYEFKLEPDPAADRVYVLFFSEPDK